MTLKAVLGVVLADGVENVRLAAIGFVDVYTVIVEAEDHARFYMKSLALGPPDSVDPTTVVSINAEVAQSHHII